MRKIIVAAALAGVLLNLAACSTPITDNERARQEKQDIANVNSNLDKGCTFSYVGDVNIASDLNQLPMHVGVVRCTGKDTITTSTAQGAREGKQTIVISGVTYEISPAEKKDSDDEKEAKN